MEQRWTGRLRRHLSGLIVGIGIVSLLAPIGGDPPSSPGVGGLAFLLFELSPFLALAVVARRLPWWLALACALVFGGLMVETAREVSESTSSTAALAFLVAPVALMLALPLLLAGSEAVRVARLRRRGGAIAPPGWGMLGSGIVLALVGFLTLSVVGLVAGLALAFVLWAGRSARAAT